MTLIKDILADKSRHWEHYLTRPFSLFGSSLWAKWYATYAQKLTSTDISDMISIEEDVGVLRNYRPKENLDALKRDVGYLAINDKEKCLEMLKLGNTLNTESEKVLSEVNEKMTLNGALDLYFRSALYSTILPHFVVEGLAYHNAQDNELVSLCLQLRSKSYYPRILKEIVIPTAADEIKSLGIDDAQGSVDLLCVEEILNKDTSNLSERMLMRKQGMLYSHYVIDHKTSFEWSKNNSESISLIEGVGNNISIKGTPAFKGVTKGVVRIVLTDKDLAKTFNEGDVLVSINSNPSFMAFIKKSSAIVTDEGGITCHAAIISRELKKPCIIGTKNATKVLKDGDMVEVDAEKGVVRIIR